MLDQQRFFCFLKAVMWLLAGLPVGLVMVLTGWVTYQITVSSGNFHGVLALLVGTVAAVEILILLHARKRAFIILCLRTATVGYGLLAYAADGGLRSYDISLTLGDRLETYCLPSLLLIASPDPTTIPRMLWEIAIELQEID
jgi:hypothetical protein